MVNFSLQVWSGVRSDVGFNGLDPVVKPTKNPLKKKDKESYILVINNNMTLIGCNFTSSCGITNV